MQKDRLEEIKEAVENLDTDKYHGADMLADALVDMAGNARELLEEIERIRVSNPFLVGDRVVLKIYEDEEGEQPTEGTVVAMAGGQAVIVSSPGFGDTLWYPHEMIERVED